MANPIKGEATLRTGDGELTLRFDFDALVAAQAAAGKPFGKITQEMVGGDLALESVFGLLKGGLAFHHGKMDDDAIKALIMSDMQGVMTAIGEGLTSAMGRPGKDAGSGPPAPARKRGTSTRSSKAGAKPA